MLDSKRAACGKAENWDKAWKAVSHRAVALWWEGRPYCWNAKRHRQRGLSKGYGRSEKITVSANTNKKLKPRA